MKIQNFRSSTIALGAFVALASATVNLDAQVLPITNGLQLWLNADVGVTTNGSGQVTAWADQSGLANNATQGSLPSAPTYAPNSLNGHATLRVIGSQYMEVPNANGIEIGRAHV